MNYIIILYLSFMLCSGTIAGVTNQKAQQKAARESIRLLKQLPMTIVRELGFKTERMVKDSSLGKPLKGYIISLDNILEFKQNHDPGKIPVDVKEVNYPVYVSEKSVSSITIREKQGKWEFAVMGRKEILFAEQARQIHTASSPGSPHSYFMVQIPAMYLTFLAYYLDGILYLIPTHEDPDLEFPLYESVLAEDLFLELKPIVEKFANLMAPSSASVQLAVGKLKLKRGESTWLKITIKGLDRYKILDLAFPFLLLNKTPGIVSMKGGNKQKHIIRPEEIDSYGIYTMTRTLTGKVPGTYNISIEFE